MALRSPKLIPIMTIAFLRHEAAIAQTSAPPPPVTQQSSPDPLTVYGVGVALLFSVGGVVVNLFKGYVGTVSRRSEIELKAQEAQNQRGQDIAVMVMEQQRALVHHLQDSQDKNRSEFLELFRQSNEAQNKMASAIESLTLELKKDKKL